MPRRQKSSCGFLCFVSRLNRGREIDGEREGGGQGGSVDTSNEDKTLPPRPPLALAFALPSRSPAWFHSPARHGPREAHDPHLCSDNEFLLRKRESGVSELGANASPEGEQEKKSERKRTLAGRPHLGRRFSFAPSLVFRAPRFSQPRPNRKKETTPPSYKRKYCAKKKVFCCCCFFSSWLFFSLALFLLSLSSSPSPLSFSFLPLLLLQKKRKTRITA